MNIKQLSSQFVSLYFYDYKWQDSARYKDLNEYLLELGFALDDPSIAGEYNDIKGYYNCKVNHITRRSK